MDTQAPPNSGARLAPQAVEALIARRLDALGHSPDLLDRCAIAALVADAGGSGRRLRSSLAATLFLASTEDAPQIDADLVHRALTPARPAIIQPGPTTQAAAVRPKRFTASRFYLLAGLVALAVSLTSLVLRPLAGKPVPEPAQIAAPENSLPPPPARIQQPPSGATAARTVPVKPETEPAAAPVPPPIQAPALAPLPPAVAVRSLPVPEASLPAAAPPSLPPLPAGPPPAIVLLYPARDPGALDRLRPLALKLQNAGVTDIRAKPVHAPPPRRVVSYFYSDDRPLADTIAKTLSGSDWPRLSGNALQPSLVLPPPGLPGRSPGTIEVQLP